MIVLLQRGWQAASGLATLYFVTRFLSPDDQGFYYTISTLVGMMVALDLGLTNILVPLTSKHVVNSANSESLGDDLLGVGSYAVRWFRYSGLLILIIAPLGLAFLNMRSESGGASLGYAWYAVVLGAVGVYMLSPFVLLLEGMGRITEVYGQRLVQGVLASLCMWLALYEGLGLYAVAIPSLVCLAATLAWLIVRHSVLLKQVWRTKPLANWSQHIWPIQWRTGANVFIGYLLVFAYTPMYYALFGPQEAGKIGLTMVCSNTLFVLSISGLVGKFPKLSKLLAEGRFKAADDLYVTEVAKATRLFGLLSIGFLIMLFALKDDAIAERFMSFTQVACIQFAMFFYLKAAALGYFLRAHLVDRTLRLNLVALLSMAVIGALLSVMLGIWGVPVALMIVFIGYLAPATKSAVEQLKQSGVVRVESEGVV